MKIKQFKIIPLVSLVVVSIFGGILFSLTATQSVSALKCTDGSVPHDDGMCYLESWNEDSTYVGSSGDKCSGGEYTKGGSGHIVERDGKKYCYGTKKTDGQVVYNDGKPAEYTCPRGQQYHADRNACYKEKVGPTSQNVGDGCQETENGDTYHGEVRFVNGQKSCYAYFETGDDPAIDKSKDPPAPLTEAEQQAKACEDQYDGNLADINACKKGVTSADCSGLTGDELEACSVGMGLGICGSQSSGDVSAQLRCDTAVRKCVDDHGDPYDAAKVKKCMQDNNNIPDDALANFLRARLPGDAGVCGKARTNIIDCGTEEGVPALANVLKIILFILTILIGIVAVGGVAYGAILYASAEDNAGQVSKAKGIIRDVAIGLLLYGLMVAIINWLIPGSVIG